ncbi:MAG: UDP-N-acetylglucosamine--N-acetylmuramyl-(pentapeptide) pyrophosphoryl-undecaprenol N-acetylglucosamine transferase [Treponema sp.]|nr:UDP-N-acetylglucosamine--N-acetylmuramyl-(pentapeptide) pyrophosphoryl-undecaprenol N-acetylglucosamine transferase [Candidatus Treponema caballi]
MKKIVFTGGGTGGHIYPGLAVVDELKKLSSDNGCEPFEIIWIASKKKIDRDIIEKAGTVDRLYRVPCGKLRRYLSFENFIDLFRIAGGFFASFFILLKEKPVFLFSKGGFVSVPPCIAARLLHIPVFTHECDVSPGLATRLNAKSARKVLVSFDKTPSFFSEDKRKNVVVTGNPVRPVFYSADAAKGREFLGFNSIPEAGEKPLLLVAGGSLGAQQINTLVTENLDWLCKSWKVVHQTGALWAEEHPEMMEKGYHEDYYPYAFIYAEMPDVLKAADVVLSRAGANFLWEASVSAKPLILIPLSGSGTRGDQVDNAALFASKDAAIVLGGRDGDGNVTAPADEDGLRSALEKFSNCEAREKAGKASRSIMPDAKPAETIAKLIFSEVNDK